MSENLPVDTAAAPATKHIEDNVTNENAAVPSPEERTVENVENEKGYTSSPEASVGEDEDFDFTFGKFMAMLVGLFYQMNLISL
jgi:hypothetical protein